MGPGNPPKFGRFDVYGDSIIDKNMINPPDFDDLIDALLKISRSREAMIENINQGLQWVNVVITQIMEGTTRGDYNAWKMCLWMKW